MSEIKKPSAKYAGKVRSANGESPPPADLLARWAITPDPVPTDWLRDLLRRGRLTQGDAARLLRVGRETANRWCAGKRAAPWSAIELLRRHVFGVGPQLVVPPSATGGGRSLDDIDPTNLPKNTPDVPAI